MELEFIEDEQLKQRIENSVTYIFLLYNDEIKISHPNSLYQTETFRVIILYTVSVIEAVLFYIYEKRGLVITKTEYKEKEYLSESFKNLKVSGRVVTAVERVIDKKESEVSLKELIQFLGTEKILKQETEEKLLRLIKTRNSVHLRQLGREVCSVEDVDGALKLLVYVLTHAPRFLK